MQYLGVKCTHVSGFPGDTVGKESASHSGDSRDAGLILGWEDPLEQEMATHSGILAWEIPWIEEPGWLQSMGSQSQGMTERACTVLMLATYFEMYQKIR